MQQFNTSRTQPGTHSYARTFKRLMGGLVLISSATLVFSASAQEINLHHPQDIASLAGEPSASGSRALPLFANEDGTVRVMRVWYPPNVKLSPHGEMKEGQAAIVTILAGDMKFAMGSEFDASRLETLPVGSVFVLTHENAAHFATTGLAGAQFLIVMGPEKDLNSEMIRR